MINKAVLVGYTFICLDTIETITRFLIERLIYAIYK